MSRTDANTEKTAGPLQNVARPDNLHWDGFMTSMGTVHGGILCDVADAAMGIAFVTTLPPDESFTTMSLTINFFRPVWEARLRFDAHVVNRSKNTGDVECEISDPDGKLIAKAMSTCTVLRGDHAKVR